MLEVGRVVKPHGLGGEVIVELVTNRLERLDPGSVLQTGGQALTVDRSSAHQGRWIVAFAGVGDREAAEALRGTVLLADPIEADDDSLWVHELVGAHVIDVSGRTCGVVDSIQANPASDLLVLDSGDLVPLRFVVGHERGRITIDPPEGLLDEH